MVSTADWKTVMVADDPASPSTPSAQHSDPRFYTPFPFVTTLKNGYTPTLAPASGLDAFHRYLISDSAGSFLSIGAQGTAEATNAFGTYQDTLVKVVEAVPDGAGFRLDSELHALYSVDVGPAPDYRLRFRNNWGVAQASDSPGYVIWGYDPASRHWKALSRQLYNTTAFTHGADSNFGARGWFVRATGTGFQLVASEGDASALSLSASPIEVSMPRDFNPDAVPYQPNPRVSAKEWVRNSRNDVESPQGKFLKDLDPQYRPQVAEVLAYE